MRLVRTKQEPVRGKWLLLVDWLADAEVGATAVVDPEAALVDTPGVAANAGRSADLANELCVAGITDVAPVSFAIVGRAPDRALPLPLPRLRSVAPDDKLSAATIVDPEAAIIDPPRASPDAG